MANNVFWVIVKIDTENDGYYWRAYPCVRENLDEMKRLFDGDEIIIAQEIKP
jgi:hypothetical protein